MLSDRSVGLAMLLRGVALALLTIVALGSSAVGSVEARPAGACDGPCPPPPKQPASDPRSCSDCNSGATKPKQRYVTVYRKTRAYSTPYLDALASKPLAAAIYPATWEANSGSRGRYSNPWWSRLRNGYWVNNGDLKGPAKMGIGNCPPPRNDRQPRGGRRGCDDCQQPANPKPAVAGTYTVAMARGFGGLAAGARRLVVDSGAKTRDDGVVVVKFFIPNRIAAGGSLQGDGRSWSSDPLTATRSRVILTWDVATGKVATTISATHVVAGKRPFTALRIVRKSRCGHVKSTDLKSRATNDLYVGRDGAGVLLCISALNSVTSRSDVGSLSVDGALSIVPNAAARGSYHVAWGGNGYPAIEAYYYPRRSPTVNTLFLRRVDPAGLGSIVDVSGGLGALDLNSFWRCSSASLLPPGTSPALKSICFFDNFTINPKRQHDRYETRLGDRAG